MPKCAGSDYVGDDCENEGTKQCAGCKSVYYCSEECQRSNWEIHIWNCKVPIHTGHYLIRACDLDLLPSDPQTRADYGFERAGEHVNMLLGLYQGLKYSWLDLTGRALTARELNKWRKEGTLVEKIHEAFKPIPESHRGGYYPWFCQNQWILDGSPIPKEHQQQAHIKRMEKKAWERIGKNQSAELSSWPDKKRACFWHYAGILSRCHPHPNMDTWIKGGYCIARDEYQEMQVSRIYRVLFDKCTFEEYWSAYDSSSVFDLINKYDVLSSSGSTGGPFVPPWEPEDAVAMVERLRLVLSSPWSYSVWQLKRCVLDDSIKPARSVVADYGFMNCRTPSERDALANKYRAVFKARDFDEVKLHEACIKGKIFEYVNERVSMTKDERKTMRRLMVNPYPLPQI